MEAGMGNAGSLTALEKLACTALRLGFSLAVSTATSTPCGITVTCSRRPSERRPERLSGPRHHVHPCRLQGHSRAESQACAYRKLS
jgi:hypothetical protein